MINVTPMANDDDDDVTLEGNWTLDIIYSYFNHHVVRQLRYKLFVLFCVYDSSDDIFHISATAILYYACLHGNYITIQLS